MQDTFKVAGLILLLIVPNLSRAESEALPLWPQGVKATGKTGGWFKKGNTPFMTPYLVNKPKSEGSAVLVCPGGGYGALAAHEAAPVAKWLNSLGISAFVLNYRHAPVWVHPAPLDDARRAIRIIRSHAEEWGIRPDHIGIIGFSAGGHLAATAGTLPERANPSASDPLDRLDSRPDIMILVYPVITMGQQGHPGSRQNLLGDKPSPELIDLLSAEKQVSPNTPPTFMVHGIDDAVVPVENTLAMATALRQAGVPLELHIFEKAPHGFGLASQHPVVSSWTSLCANWLRLHGFMP